jgi:hypothetical protein
MRNTVYLGTILLATLVSVASGGGGRFAIPTGAEEARLRRAIEIQYSELFSSPERADQLTLSRQLWEASGHADSDGERYELLCESRDAAARAGDFIAAMRICDAVAARFNVSLGAVRAGIFAAGAGSLEGGLELQHLYFSLLVKSIDQALLADDFESARAMIETGSAAATNAGSVEGRAGEPGLALRRGDLETQFKAYNAIKPAMDRLRQDPSDPRANLAVGEYDCLVKGNWSEGLPLLLQGSDDDLRAAAERELRNPRMTGSKRAIGDAWEALVVKLPEYAMPLHVHAYDWYVRTLPAVLWESKGPPNRAPFEQRLTALVPLVEGRRPHAAMWFAIADCLSWQRTSPSAIVGGALAKDRFDGVPDQGGLLIGLRASVAMQAGRQVVTYVQPIYLTPDGEQTGLGYGQQISAPRTLRAPPGYAVGAVEISGGDGINSIALAFMRIEGDRLNPAQTLKPVRIGGTGGVAVDLNGNGTPIVGICGRQSGGYLGLGVVYAPALAKGSETARVQ